MSRRSVLLTVALGCFVAALESWAQQPNQVRLVGRLAISSHLDDSVNKALRQGLRELGYIEGRDFRIEHRSADGHIERLPALAEELVRLKVDVIVTGTDEATRAAKGVTTAIPIVAVLYDHDPVAAGFINSFSRPGGNITGLTVRNTELAGKRLELMKEALPNLSRVAVLFDSFGRRELDVLRPAARSLGLQLQLLELKAPYDFPAAFRTAKAQKAGAVIVLTSPVFYVNASKLGGLALENRLPASSVFRDLVDAGGLMLYGTDVADGFHRAAYFIDRVFKGAKPGDLPFEQTERVRLVLNLRTANALGLAIPQSTLLRADEVIR